MVQNYLCLVDKLELGELVMNREVLKQLTDVIDEVTDLDKKNGLSDQLTPMILTAMMVLTIKKNTTEEERGEMINASLDRIKFNLLKEFGHKTFFELNTHLEETRNRLIGMLL